MFIRTLLAAATCVVAYLTVMSIAAFASPLTSLLTVFYSAVTSCLAVWLLLFAHTDSVRAGNVLVVPADGELSALFPSSRRRPSRSVSRGIPPRRASRSRDRTNP